ncbi:hypothetical protein LCGC14_1608510 [marine sediment metagenome]|uniref:Uncharacterized protein n=1 Tax=marine sediment metagenome TaxID=412755 RepID=A0A0F9I918_9ZZZZ
MSRYSKEHYEDVARIIVGHNGGLLDTYSPANHKCLADDFAELFAADNPPSTHCWHCGSNRNVVTDCTHVEHNYGGFDREQFLTACGLEPQQ